MKRRKELRKIRVQVRGGNSGNIYKLAPKLGPLGVSPRQVNEDIYDLTKNFPQIKVLVEISIGKHGSVENLELIPTTASLIFQKVGRSNRKKENESFFYADLTFKDILDISKKMRIKSRAKEFKGTVKEVLGTCQSCGVMVEGSLPQNIQRDLAYGRIELPSFN